MSLNAYCWATSLKYDSPLQKLAMLMMADNVNQDGECRVRYEYLQRECFASKDEIRKVLAELVEKGIISYIEKDSENFMRFRFEGGEDVL